MSAVLEAVFERYAYARAGLLEAPREDRAPGNYEDWLQGLFPSYVTAPMGDHHREVWDWVEALEPGVQPDPLVLVLPRGGAKSTTAELACVRVGALKKRKYILYISATQKPQADDHVANIGGLLEAPTVARYYPSLSDRLVGKFGNPRGWRHNRLSTASGLTVDALGLDVAGRGLKFDEQRPDMIVFDDVDDAGDSMETVRKKVERITQKILPAGSSDVAVLVVQNVVHHESVVARLVGLASEPADFLTNRKVIGPLPALRGAEFEKQTDGTWRIIRGEPIWQGQTREICERQVNLWGIRAFRAEAQHERTPPEGQAFPEFDPSIHVCAPFPIPAEWARARIVDYGYSSPFAQLWLTRSPAGRIYAYRENYGTRKTASEQAYEMRMLSAGEQFRFSLGDPAMWATQREGKAYQSVADQYGEMGVMLQPASNDRLAGKALVHQVLAWSELSPPILQIFNTCHNLIRTLPMLPSDPHKPEDVDTLAEDHLFDCLRYGLMAMPWLDSMKRQKPRDYRVGSGRRA